MKTRHRICDTSQVLPSWEIPGAEELGIMFARIIAPWRKARMWIKDAATPVREDAEGDGEWLLVWITSRYESLDRAGLDGVANPAPVRVWMENYWLFPSPCRARLDIRRNTKTRYASIGHAIMNDPCPSPHVLKTAQFSASKIRARGTIRKNPRTVARTPFNTPLFISKLHQHPVRLSVYRQKPALASQWPATGKLTRT